jgi:hypothetical protein
MSFGNAFKMFSGVQQIFVVALIVVMVVAVSLNIDLTYKIGIGVLVFTLLFLVTSAVAVLREQKESKKA